MILCKRKLFVGVCDTRVSWCVQPDGTRHDLTREIWDFTAKLETNEHVLTHAI